MRLYEAFACLAGGALVACSHATTGSATTGSATTASPPQDLVRHVVAFRFHDDVSQARIDDVVRAFKGLKAEIPTILSLDAGLDDLAPYERLANPTAPLTKGFSYYFVVTFASVADRDDYVNVEPHHQAFKQMVGPLLEDVFVFDFTSRAALADPDQDRFERFVAVRPSPSARPDEVDAFLRSLHEDSTGFEVGTNDSPEGLAKGMTIAFLAPYSNAGGLDNGVGSVEAALAHAVGGLLSDAIIADIAVPRDASNELYLDPVFGPYRAATCNGGAATVDRLVYGDGPLPTSEFFFTLRDPGVTDYLRGAAAAFGDTDGLPGVPASAYAAPADFSMGEATSAADFGTLEGYRGGTVTYPDDARNPAHRWSIALGTRAFRDGPGLKVVVYRPALSHLVTAPEREVANWYFESCR
jgi:hypothetical protein